MMPGHVPSDHRPLPDGTPINHRSASGITSASSTAGPSIPPVPISTSMSVDSVREATIGGHHGDRDDGSTHQQLGSGGHSHREREDEDMVGHGHHGSQQPQPPRPWSRTDHHHHQPYNNYSYPDQQQYYQQPHPQWPPPVNRSHYTPIGAIGPPYGPGGPYSYGPPDMSMNSMNMNMPMGAPMSMSRHNFYNGPAYGTPMGQQMYNTPIPSHQHQHASSHPLSSQRHNLRESLEEFRVTDPRGYKEWYIKYQEAKKLGKQGPPLPQFPVVPNYRPPRSGRSSVNHNSLSFSEYPPSNQHETSSSMYNNMMNMSGYNSMNMSLQNQRPPIDIVNEPADLSLASYPQSESVSSDRQTPLKFVPGSSGTSFFGFNRNCGGINSGIIITNGSKFRIRSIEELIDVDNGAEWVKIVKNGIGPVKRSTTHKSTILQFCQKRIEEIDTSGTCSEDLNNLVLIWELLLLLVKQNGSVVGSDLADLLLSKLPNSVTTENEDQVEESQISDPTNHIQTFTSHLQSGQVFPALNFAISNGLWSHAIYLSSTISQASFKETMEKFARSEIHRDKPLLTTFYSIFGVGSKNSRIKDEDFSSGFWIHHLAMILSNIQQPEIESENRGDRILYDLKSKLESHNLLYGSQLVSICMEILNIPFQNEHPLLYGLNEGGTNRLYAYQLTEILRFGMKRENELTNWKWILEQWEYYKSVVTVLGVKSEVAKGYLEAIGKGIVAQSQAEDLRSIREVVKEVAISVWGQNLPQWTKDLELQDSGYGDQHQIEKLEEQEHNQNLAQAPLPIQNQNGYYKDPIPNYSNSSVIPPPQARRSIPNEMNQNVEIQNGDEDPNYNSTYAQSTTASWQNQSQGGTQFFVPDMSLSGNQSQGHEGYDYGHTLDSQQQQDLNTIPNNGYEGQEQNYEYHREGEGEQLQQLGQDMWNMNLGTGNSNAPSQNFQHQPQPMLINQNHPQQMEPISNYNSENSMMMNVNMVSTGNSRPALPLTNRKNKKYPQQSQPHAKKRVSFDDDELEETKNSSPSPPSEEFPIASLPPPPSLNFSSTFPIDRAISPRRNPNILKPFTFPIDRKCCEADQPCEEHKVELTNSPFTPTFDPALNQPMMMPIINQKQPAPQNYENPTPSMHMPLPSQKSTSSFTNDEPEDTNSNPKPQSNSKSNSLSKDQDKQKSSSSWLKSLPFFGSTSSSKSGKLPSNRPTPMKLPSDTNPSIVWDEAKGRWVSKDEEEDEALAPAQLPPKDSELNNNKMMPGMPMPPKTQFPSGPKPPGPGQIIQNGPQNNMMSMPGSMPPGSKNSSNKYSLQKGRGPRAGYVDVFKPQMQSQQQNQGNNPGTQPPQMSGFQPQQQQFFVPNPSND